MNTAPHLQTVEIVEAKIAEHYTLVKDYAKDVTLETARTALAQVTAAKEKADEEDESIDPAELIDRRVEAAREVEVAKIRLERAEKAQGQHGARTLVPLQEAQTILAKALLSAAGPIIEKIEAGARRVFGDGIYSGLKHQFDAMAYKVQREITENATYVENHNLRTAAEKIQAITRAIEALNDAHRDR